MELLRILSERNYAAGYVVRKEQRRFGNNDDDPVVMSAAYTPSGAYIGSSQTAYRLCKVMGIKPEANKPDDGVCSIGFCSQNQKWYGWSHRAIFGFGVGDQVKKGDCAYIGATPEDLIENHVTFFSDLGEDRAKLARQECQILEDGSGIRILHAPLVIPMADSLEEALDEDAELELVDIHKDNFSVVKCGRGEWTAETLEDAKQMACDFAEDVG